MMEPLPHELQKMILDRLDWDIDTLISCSKVCVAWEKWSQEIFNRKCPLNMPKTFQEIKAMTRIQITDENQATVEQAEPDSLEIFKTFQRTYLPSNFQIGELTPEDGPPDIPNSWLGSICEMRKCGCEKPYDDRVCLISGLRFMPAHGLILIGVPETLDVFGDRDPVNSLTDSKYCVPYKIEPKHFPTGRDAHSCISIYQNTFVAQEDSRCFIYCKVPKVDHTNRTVWIDRLRRVFTPFWSDLLVLFDEKVFIMYTTGSIGVWTVDPDHIDISDDNLSAPAGFTLESVVRINNLILTSQQEYFGQGESGTFWGMLDTDVEKSENVHIPLNSLVNSLQWVEDSKIRVLRVVVWNNALIFHYQLRNQKSKSSPTNPRGKRIFALRMRRDPKLEDFRSVENFKDLFYPGFVATISQDRFNFGETITSPFPVLQKRKRNNVANIFGYDQAGADPDRITHHLVLYHSTSNVE